MDIITGSGKQFINFGNLQKKKGVIDKLSEYLLI